MPPSGPLGFDQHIRTGLTPNESGIRSGLTPGGGGFFPASSSASQLFQQFVAPGVSTPGTMEFKKTAMSAAAKKSGFTASTSPQMEKTTLPDVSTISNDLANKSRRASLIDNMHDPGQTAAANGLYLLAQQTHTQPENQFANNGTIIPAQSLAPSSLMTETSGMHKPPLISNMPGGPTLGRMSNNTRGISEMSEDISESGSENGGQSGSGARGGRNTRRGGSTAGGRRKASDDSGKARKRSKVSGDGSDDEMMDDEKNQQNGEKSTKKMTDEEKRKNFLERNR
jgi:ATF/CREB family transcription factor